MVDSIACKPTGGAQENVFNDIPPPPLGAPIQTIFKRMVPEAQAHSSTLSDRSVVVSFQLRTFASLKIRPGG